MYKTVLLFSSQIRKTMKKQKFGPNVIYFALGITEGRPAGPFGQIKLHFEPDKRPAGPFRADYYYHYYYYHYY